ncbi:MAG: DUF1707 domain-containing protein [Streptosporangiaceae bacterium]|nr:DUF1707 domain-containing protein [Streptosporangiaceae bacterium]MBV9855670.1 DUF1707 domain-containing protein [Streptosporangiaceae bacterium]
MSEPGDETAGTGQGRLRASHADRDQAIEVLKIAFVQGRLVKDELDARVAQAFASRTYAELAAVTADLPPGLLAEQPSLKPARAHAGPSMNAAITGGAFMMLTATTLMVAAVATGSGVAVLVVALFMTVGVAAALAAMIFASEAQDG